MSIAVIITPSAIVANGIYQNTRHHVNISKTDKKLYEKALDAYKKGDYEEIIRIGDLATNLESYSDGLFYVKNDRVYTTDLNKPAPPMLSTRIISFYKEGIPVNTLVNFWNKLQNNISQKVREQLYTFLENSNIPLTSDGCFVAYKSVSVGKDGNLWDSYTFKNGKGTYRNNVGDIVEMDRSKVDDNPNCTCSNGLHVAAFDYAVNNYGVWTSGVGEGQKLVHVKIDPEDVVSVPNDYDGQKMRVCKYEVIDTSEDRRPIQDHVYDYDDDEDDFEFDQNEDDRIDHLEKLAEDIEEPDEEDIYDAEDDEVENVDKKIILSSVKARYDGRLEIPKDVIDISNLNGKNVSVIHEKTPYYDTIIIIETPHSNRIMREGFRIPFSIFKDANMVHYDYVVEVIKNKITISLP